MYVQLLRRSGIYQRTAKGLWLPVRLDQIVWPDGRLNEEMLLRILPKGWLPAPPGEILVSLAHSRGSTGLRQLSRFRPWARHFDCWVLELWREEPR